MLLARTEIGPRDHGRRMSLKQFEFAQVEDGSRYEPARGDSRCSRRILE